MNVRKFLILGAIGVILAPFWAVAQDEEPPEPQPAWAELSDSQRRGVFAFAEDYKDFMSRAKTEISFVVAAVTVARAAGFRELTQDSNLRPGGRFYDINRDRAITLIVVGSNDFIDGFRVVGAHIDSPRLELKGRPLYEKEGFALFQTYRHGGIKNYQWVNLPLALVGHNRRGRNCRTASVAAYLPLPKITRTS